MIFGVLTLKISFSNMGALTLNGMNQEVDGMNTKGKRVWAQTTSSFEFSVEEGSWGTTIAT